MDRIAAALSDDHIRATGGFALAAAILIGWVVVALLR